MSGLVAGGDTAIRSRLMFLRNDNATDDEQVAAFAEAAHRRSGEPLSDITMQAEHGMLAGYGQRSGSLKRTVDGAA